MSKTVERAIQDVAKSIFDYDEKKRKFVVEGAVILWPNFSGEEDRFGNSARTFNVAVTQEWADKLTDLGYRVRVVENKDENDEVTGELYVINVKVNMATDYPPKVYLITETNNGQKRTVLNESKIGLLDRVDIAHVDVIINSYTSKRFPDKTTGYLDKIYVTQESAPYFGGKYDDWSDVEE